MKKKNEVEANKRLAGSAGGRPATSLLVNTLLQEKVPRTGHDVASHNNTRESAKERKTERDDYPQA